MRFFVPINKYGQNDHQSYKNAKKNCLSVVYFVKYLYELWVIPKSHGNCQNSGKKYIGFVQFLSQRRRFLFLFVSFLLRDEETLFISWCAIKDDWTLNLILHSSFTPSWCFSAILKTFQKSIHYSMTYGSHNNVHCTDMPYHWYVIFTH